MLPQNHTLTTVVWLALNTLPLAVAALVWSLLSSFWGIVLLLLFPLYIIPYGFFVSLPLMVKLFRKPASIYRR
jgi:hypothetical protein